MKLESEAQKTEAKAIIEEASKAIQGVVVAFLPPMTLTHSVSENNGPWREWTESIYPVQTSSSLGTLHINLSSLHELRESIWRAFSDLRRKDSFSQTERSLLNEVLYATDSTLLD